MKRRTVTPCVLALALLPAAFAADDKPARDAETIVKEYKATTLPTFDTTNQKDTAYIRNYMDQRKQAVDKRQALAMELYRTHPDHPEVPALLVERWQSMLGQKGNEVIAESDEYLKSHPDSPKKPDILFTRAVATYYSTRDADKTLAAADAFIAAAPADDRGPQLLSVVSNLSHDPDQKEKLNRRLAEQFPNSSAAKMARGHTKQTEGVGKPFDLSFTEAITGKKMSLDQLRGKVVVIDFWATWCGPCVAEMPRMKQLYADFKPKGIEFIGVSLDQPEDQGGLKKLKEFCAKNEITWPQFYQGNGWNSDFSGSWGIDSIPRVFLIDAEGNLSTTQARGRLEELIPGLLAKRNDKQAAAP